MGKNVGLGYRPVVSNDVEELTNKVNSLTAEKESLVMEINEVREINSQLQETISSLTAEKESLEKELADKKKKKDE